MCEIVANLYYAKIGKKLHARIRKKKYKMYHNPQHTNNLVCNKVLIHNKQVFGKNEYSSLKARILCCWTFKDEFLKPNVIDKVFMNNEN